MDQSLPQTYQLASYWRRFTAFSIDYILLILVVLYPQLLFANTSIFLLIIPLGYVCLSIGLLILTSQSIGKMLLGIKVVNIQGQKLAWQKVLIRETIGRIVSLFSCGLGYFWILLDAKRQGFHDSIVGSVVVATTAASTASQPEKLRIDTLLITAAITENVTYMLFVAYATAEIIVSHPYNDINSVYHSTQEVLAKLPQNLSSFFLVCIFEIVIGVVLYFLLKKNNVQGVGITLLGKVILGIGYSIFAYLVLATLFFFNINSF